MKMRWLLAATTLLLLTEAPVGATVYDIYPTDDLFARLQDLQAGDEVIVHAGTYNRSGFFEVTWNGTAGAPIVVRAAAGDRPVIDCAAGQNIINIYGSFFELRGLELTGGSHGVRLYDAHDAVLEDLEIHHTDEAGLSANISGNEYYHLTFRRLNIHHTGGTGEGMYLGCNTAGCIFRDNVIEGNWIHDTVLGTSQGDGIEIKQGSYGNIVRNNVIHDTQYPCIIVYGTQGHAVNVVENNVMWNCADSGIQAAADAVVQNNIILNAGNGINSHLHDGAAPSRLSILHNTVVGCTDRCLRASDWAGSTGIVVANNAFYNEGGNAVRLAGGESDISFHHNVVLGNVEGVTSGYTTGNSVAADFTDAAHRDVWPTAGSPLPDQGDPGVGVTVDFNWTTRDANPDVGAYEWAASGNPGWDVEPGFRVDPDGGVPPITDAAVPADAASPGTDGGSPGPDGTVSPGTDAGADTDAGTPPSDDNDGCGCHQQGAGSGLPAALVVLWLLGFIRARRRRDRPA